MASTECGRTGRSPSCWPIAAALRAVALVAIYPGIWFSDSNDYVTAAATGRLSTTRVDGYAFLVAPFHALGSAGALIVLQHVLGLMTVVVLYALLVRRGVPRWIALLGVVPAALDAYLIVVEHAIMSEAVYHAALFAALACLLWRDRLGLVAAAGGGLLLGYAGIVRSVAIPLVGVVLVYLLVRRVGWRPLTVFAIGWLLVVPAATRPPSTSSTATFGFTHSGGRFLYAQGRAVRGLRASSARCRRRARAVPGSCSAPLSTNCLPVGQALADPRAPGLRGPTPARLRQAGDPPPAGGRTRGRSRRRLALLRAGAPDRRQRLPADAVAVPGRPARLGRIPATAGRSAAAIRCCAPTTI